MLVSYNIYYDLLRILALLDDSPKKLQTIRLARSVARSLAVLEKKKKEKRSRKEESRG